MEKPIVIKRSTDEDRVAIRDLAALDSRPPPEGEALLAFIGSELRAALPLDGGEAIADPFHHTAELVELLQVRRLAVHRAAASGHTGRRRYGRRAYERGRHVLPRARQVVMNVMPKSGHPRLVHSANPGDPGS